MVEITYQSLCGKLIN